MKLLTWIFLTRNPGKIEFTQQSSHIHSAAYIYKADPHFRPYQIQSPRDSVVYREEKSPRYYERGAHEYPYFFHPSSHLQKAIPRVSGEGGGKVLWAGNLSVGERVAIVSSIYGIFMLPFLRDNH